MTNDSSRAWLRALELTAPIPANPKVILPTVVERLAGKFGDAPALLSDGSSVSYRELAARVDRYARWAIGVGLGKGEVVCLLMPNCPDYFAIWLGISRAGGIVSLLNTNQRGAALEHSIALVSPRHVIVAAALEEAYLSLGGACRSGPAWWAHGGDMRDLPRVDTQAVAFAAQDADDRRAPSIHDTALYLYTSGTTGLPKAAPVSHYRLMQWSHWFAGMMGTTREDRMYNCLPMYHSVGGVVAIGAALIGGGSVVLRDRFSSGEFWQDIARWDCTLFQYIGEICRYLLKAQSHPLEASHRIRLACGNGLSGEIWEAFQSRFRIPRILEFYAATEGTVSLYNCDGRVGAIGRFPPFLSHRKYIEILRCDPETGVPVRGEDGLCLRCESGEAGLAAGRISDDSRFLGYTDPEATQKKILRNVFAPGDAWFSTGDLMRRDTSGYFYFVDRIGDTFRWKGENVSTTEVANVVAGCTGVADAAVYGVPVPHSDGRAGMAAIVADDAFGLQDFHDEISQRLPAYAQPLFLRICRHLDRTGTFKPQKQRLSREGYDPELVTDAIYLRTGGGFVPLDAALFGRIRDGSIRL
jgi:fatty-acyl-CoA synthase